MEIEAVGKILRDNITFSGQLGDYVVHGAIDRIIQLHKSILKQKIMAYEYQTPDITPDGPEFVKLWFKFGIKEEWQKGYYEDDKWKYEDGSILSAGDLHCLTHWAHEKGPG